VIKAYKLRNCRAGNLKEGSGNLGAHQCGWFQQTQRTQGIFKTGKQGNMQKKKDMKSIESEADDEKGKE